jgi:peroxiredoxin Q/BCP
MITHLKIRDKAPSINSIDQNGDAITLEKFKGKKIVLYFYPKDMTPGCTVQSCNLRDNYKSFLDNGYVLLGCSADSPDRHIKFIEKHNLPFSLISDESKTVLNDYGVWGLKKFMGREYDGIHRITFVINENRIIEDIIEKVNTKEHTLQIIEQ